MAHLVLHGHTYQPPRENPFTGVVPVEPTAAPYHNWNERITEECYRPMAWARIVDEGGRVVDIVNLFEVMSFDLAPTLAQWLAANAPDVYKRIIDADNVTGTAIAHPYHHAILPLSDARDRRTELAWGLADFRARFGREPAGVWLPEGAVDDATMRSVSEAGIGFVPLLSDQVVGGRPGTAVRAHGVDLVLADAGFSRDLAFGVFGGSSAALVERAGLLANETGLAFAMTDSETFGHHHRFTERTLAYALTELVSRHQVDTGSLASWLADQPRRADSVVRTSSWSCVHGVERWRSDCGCWDGERGGNQAWRAPLRVALDVVRERARAVFLHVGSGVFRDPWAARDAYGEALARPDELEAVLEPHLRCTDDLPVARLLLESQRHALAMYTSCAWFFDDIARLESIVALRHAARCLDLLALAGVPWPGDNVLAILGDAISNEPAEGTGADIWRRHVEPARFPPAIAVPSARPDPRLHLVVESVRRAIQTETPDDIETASHRLSTDGVEVARARAQELLFEALVGRGSDHVLASLGAQVGLAVEQVTASR